MTLELLYETLGMAFLVGLSACFSAAETAVSAFSASRIHKFKTKGMKRAAIVEGFGQKRQLLVGAMLVGNTIVNVLCTSLSTVFFVEMLGPEKGLLVSSGLMMVIVLFFAEILPKSYSVQDPDHSVMKFSQFMYVTNIFLMPITMAFHFATSFIFGLLKISSKNVVAAADVMRDMIALHANRGTMSKDDLNMLNSIFDLANTEISKVMTPRCNVFSLDIGMEKEELVSAILNSPHSRVPIWKGDTDGIVGVLHVKDLVEEINRLNNDLVLLDLHGIMMRPWFVPETTLLSMQLHSFKKAKRHLAFVIDEYGTFQGIVTLEDILEEIVGNISDEHDLPEETLMEKLSDNVFLIKGLASVRDVNRSFDLDLPEDSPTLAGLLIKRFERIPDEGDEIKFAGFKFKVLQKTSNIIDKLEVSVLNEE